MRKPIRLRISEMAAPSATSDSQVGFAAGTAACDNLSAIMRNNLVIFESDLLVLEVTPVTPDAADQSSEKAKL